MAAKQQTAAPPTQDPEKPAKTGGAVVPPKLITGADVKLPRSARRQKLNGAVEIYLWVEQDGSPSHVKVVKSLRPDLDELAAEAVRKYRFEPAMQNGKPVVVELYVNVNIEIL